jgi:hypothetical protein
MGSKKTAGKRVSGAGPSKKTAYALLHKAQAELTTLLKRNESGHITRKQLDSGLKEVEQQLGQLNIHIHSGT